MSAESAQAIAGLAKTGAGAASQFSGAAQTFGAADDILSVSQEEAQAIVDRAASQSDLLHQHANAAYADISTLQALTESHTRTLQVEEKRAVGGVAAIAQSSGVSPTSGSPLLAELTTAIESERRIGAENLVNVFGERKLRFAAEEALKQAGEITKEATSSVASLARLRALQASQLRQRAMRTALGGFDALTDKNTIKSLNILLSSKTDNSMSELV